MANRTVAQLRLGFDRVAGAQACRNLMGKLSYYGSALRSQDALTLWSQRSDSLLWLDFGVYHGYSAISQYYLEVLGDRNDPGKLDSSDMKGTMVMHCMDTQMLEVAGDGQTARGCWLSPGHDTHVVDGVPQANWCWQKYQADFILENGVWKIWKLHIMPLFNTPYDVCWVDQPKTAPVPQKGCDPVPRETYTYSPDTPYPADEPWLPVPYETYSELPDIYV
jgi:hypothetical protein